MIDRIKYIATLSTVGIINLVLTYSLTILCTLLTVALSLFHLLHTPDTAVGPHSGGEVTALMIALQKPLQVVLIIIIFVLGYVAIAAGTRYAAAKVTHRIVKDKSENYIYPLLDTVIAKCRALQPEPLKKGANFAVIKLRFIQNISAEKENKWVKRALTLGLKKLNLNETDLNREGLDMYDIIREKTIKALYENTSPSMVFMLIMLFAQWICMVLILLDVVK